MRSNIMRASTVVGAVTATLTLLGQGVAQAAPLEWNATGTQADVVGAWAHGTAEVTGSFSEKYKVTTVIKDTKRDGASARVYFRWRYAHGAFSPPTSLTASGMGATNEATYVEDRGRLDSYDPFEVKEVIVDDGWETDQGGWDVPYTYND